MVVWYHVSQLITVTSETTSREYVKVCFWNLNPSMAYVLLLLKLSPFVSDK